MGFKAQGTGRGFASAGKAYFREQDRRAKEDNAPAKAWSSSAPAPSTTSVDLSGGGTSNFAADLKSRRKKTRTTFGGDTGGWGGNTKLG